jgi:CheY-like chemotaxis protein
VKRALEGIHVLLVEDDPDSLELLEFYLSDQGAAVATARTAGQAREVLAAKVPDVLVSDLSLPDEDGLALMASIRKSPATLRLPAIAITGYSDNAALQRMKKAGFDTRIVKPIELEDVRSAIVTLLSREVPQQRAE